MRSSTLLLFTGLLMLTGCGDSGTTTAPSTQQRVEEHLKEAGAALKSAATEAGSQVKPAIDKAKTATEDALHRAAEKVADMTATQPAPRPQ